MRGESPNDERNWLLSLVDNDGNSYLANTFRHITHIKNNFIENKQFALQPFITPEDVIRIALFFCPEIIKCSAVSYSTVNKRRLH